MDAIYFSPYQVLVDNAVEASRVDPLLPGMVVYTLGYASAHDGLAGSYHYNPTATGSSSQNLIVPNGNRQGRLQIRSSASGATTAEPTGISSDDLLAQKNAGTMIPYNFYKLTDIPVNLFSDTPDIISPIVISRAASLTTAQIAKVQSIVGTSVFAMHFGTAVLNSFAMYDTALGVYRKITLSNGSLIPSSYP